MITINQLAENLSHMFKFKEDVQRTVFNEEIVDDNVRDMFFEAGMDIDDYHFSWLDNYMRAVADEVENTPYKPNFDDIHYKVRDSIEADVYTSNLTEWLNSKNSRVYYLTEALEEIELKDGFKLLAYAQTREIEEVYQMGFEVIQKYIEYMGGLEEVEEEI